MGMIQTSQRELEAFYAMALPGFLDYLKVHGTSVDRVEMATTIEGITSLPGRYRLGGVEKNVLVPMDLLTKGVDIEIEACREATVNANTAADNANAAAQRVETAIEDVGAVKQAALDAAAEALEAAGTVLESAEAAREATLKAEAATSEAKAATERALQAAGAAEETDREVSENEELRAMAETNRALAEETRVAVESLRDEAEKIRAASEEGRLTAEGIREESETLRRAAETMRSEAETVREKQEAARHQAEKERQEAERLRQEAEATREQKETERIGNEAKRVQTETERQAAEVARATAENQRVSAENSRILAEEEREEKEAERKIAEANRETAESSRKASELTRKETEASRIEAENLRVSAEDLRILAEDGRRTAEDGRVTAEALRAELAAHPMKPQGGFWFEWDIEAHEYRNTGIQAKGDVGDSFRIIGRYDTLEELETKVPDGTGIDGVYAVGETEPYDYFAWLVVDGVWKWDNQGKLRGAEGKSSYEVWEELPENEGKTLDEYFDYLSPLIDPETGRWKIQGVDTGVQAEAIDAHVTVKENEPDTYILHVKSAGGEFDTPNLRGFDVKVREAETNTPEEYKLEITTVEGTFKTPNLQGRSGSTVIDIDHEPDEGDTHYTYNDVQYAFSVGDEVRWYDSENDEYVLFKLYAVTGAGAVWEEMGSGAGSLPNDVILTGPSDLSSEESESYIYLEDGYLKGKEE
ncbi:hypothetical protein ACPYIV_18145 [Parabacteroides sp. ASD2025]|uniref:hypothetical protein n=1 Tax=Parabacteroides sp. ASD2025 TaxID=3415987 RepID=UPI003CF965A1